MLRAVQPVFGCAVVTQPLTFDIVVAPPVASTRTRVAVACFQAIRSKFAWEICSLSCLFNTLSL